MVADRLRGEGIGVEDLDLALGIPGRCSVLLVAGPASPLSPAEALAIQTFVARGRRPVGRGAEPNAARGDSRRPGSRRVLAEEGLGLPPAIAVDPSLTVRELPGALLVVDGYTDHPINTGFRGARATLWFQPRAVIATGAAKPLVLASAASWGERDLEAAPPQQDADDLAGPVVLAAVGPHRVIAHRLGGVDVDRRARGRRERGRPVARPRGAVPRRQARAHGRRRRARARSRSAS